jgi:hypothetical protein
MFRHQGAFIRELGGYCFKYLLNLRTFVAEKLPDDGILVPKPVEVSTWHEVCQVIILF